MYYVIFKYNLKAGKKLEEVKKWMRENEATQARWGAVAADFYRPLFSPGHSFFARYQVKSLDRWHEAINSPQAAPVFEGLAELVDFDKSERWVFEEIPY